MKKPWLRMAPFPLALMAFAGIGVSYFNAVFTTTTRWVFLALLAAVLVPQARIFAGLKNGFGWILAAYFVWCLGTVTWSTVPELSLLKSMALILTALTFLSGGYYWATMLRPEKALAYLIPITFLTLIASVGARTKPDVYSQGVRLYEGLAGNPNFLGMLIAISFPWALYQVYRVFYYRSSVRARLFACGLVGALGMALWLSASRASILCALITLFFATTAVTTNKKLILTLVLGLGVIGTVVIAPRVQTSLYNRFVLKGGGTDDVLYSRAGPWKESYDAALQGGYFGVGYGVSVGDTNFNLGFTAEKYGREKGNTQLAVWEETGLVGLTLYTILLFAIVKELYRGLRAARDDDLTIILSIIFGMVVGMTIQSAFEAWWVAPGSLESAGFWAIVGIGTGLAKRTVTNRKRATIAVERGPLVQVNLIRRSRSDSGSPV